MYTLVGSPKTRAFRVLWMLEEVGADYEMKPVFGGSAEALAFNPSGKIPVLLVDGQAITDSVAILQYLADKHSMHTFAAGTLERARQDSFTQFGVDDLESPCWNHAKHSFVLPQNLRVEAAKPAFEYDFNRALAAFEKRLGDNEFVMGAVFTVPDLLIGHIAGWARGCGYQWLPGKVTEYFERVRARPAFARAWKIREAG